VAEVVLENITKKYPGEIVAVRDVSLEIPDGKFVVLVGPSGCGKTTLLRMIAGLEEITEGSIRIGDRTVNLTPAKDRDVAMVFQNYALYPHMTVRQNLSFSLKLKKIAKAEIANRIEATSKLLNISELLERKPGALSGGQRQRVAMGRAIVRNPAVFLFDEPLSNLDARLRVEMRRELSALHRRLKTTMVYVTHDQVEAMTLGETIVVMNEGKIQQVGTPLEVYDRPVNRFVGGFLGTPPMNFLEGKRNQESETLSWKLKNEDVSIPFTLPAQIEKTERVRTIGIRPEHLQLGPTSQTENSKSETFSFKAVVEDIQTLGAESSIFLTVGNRKIVVREDGRPSWKRGDAVHVLSRAESLHFFDEDGSRISF